VNSIFDYDAPTSLTSFAPCQNSITEEGRDARVLFYVHTSSGIENILGDTSYLIKSVTSFLNSLGASECTQWPASNVSSSMAGKNSFVNGILW